MRPHEDISEMLSRTGMKDGETMALLAIVTSTDEGPSGPASESAHGLRLSARSTFEPAEFGIDVALDECRTGIRR